MLVFEETIMAKIDGTIHLDLLPDKSVRLLFAPRGGDGKSQPIGIPSTAQALSDLTSFWQVPEGKAVAATAELEPNANAEVDVSVDEAAVAPLFERTA
jgi:hypothetical protein